MFLSCQSVLLIGSVLWNLAVSALASADLSHPFSMSMGVAQCRMNSGKERGMSF